jgi:hypothetical protein
MWQKLRPLVLLLSISLNISFVVVWGIHAYNKPVKSCHPTSCPDSGNCKISCPLHRDLGTTEEQWRILEPMQTQYRAASQSVCREVGNLRIAMLDQLMQQNVQRDSLRSKQDQIIEAQRKMQDLTIEHLLAEKQILSPAQYEKLLLKLRTCEGCEAQGSVIGLGQMRGTCGKDTNQTPK